MGFVHCNLRVLMAERGLNIQNVKDQTTLSRTTISNLYNNYGSGVQFDTLVQLCTLLKCTPGDLLTLVDITLEFEQITSDLEVDTFTKSIFHEETVEEDGKYVSKISTCLKVKCSIKYEGTESNFDFKADIKADLNEHINVTDFSKVTSNEYKINLSRLNSPFYVEEFIDDKLDVFLVEWILEYVYSLK